MISQHSSSMRGKMTEAARLSRSQLSASGGDISADGSPAASMGNPAGLVDALHTATSVDAFSRAVQALRRAVVEQPYIVLSVASAVAANELNWLHVMQRVFNDSNDPATHLALVDIVAILSTVNEPRLYKTLLAGKLSSLLTVHTSDPVRVAQAISRTIREKSDVNLFLQRQQGLQNVETFSNQAPLHASALLALHLLSLEPAAANDFHKSRLSILFGQKAIGLVKSKLDDAETREGLRLAMMVLRYFVSLHATDLGFLQMLAVLASTQVIKHVVEMSDLACDVCNSLLATKTIISTTSVPKMLPSLFVCGPYIARRGYSRFVEIAQYFSQFVCAQLVTSRDEKTLTQLYACAMHFLKPPFEKTVRCYLVVCASLLTIVGPKKVTSLLRVGQFRRLRGFIDDMKSDPGEQSATRLVLERLLYQIARDAPCAWLTGVFLPLAPRVQSGALSAAEYNLITGAPFDEKKATAFDAHIELVIATARTAIAALEATEAEARETIRRAQEAENESHHVAHYQGRHVIASGASERRFECFVLPVRRMLAARKEGCPITAVTPVFLAEPNIPISATGSAGGASAAVPPMSLPDALIPASNAVTSTHPVVSSPVTRTPTGSIRRSPSQQQQPPPPPKVSPQLGSLRTSGQSMASSVQATASDAAVSSSAWHRKQRLIVGEAWRALVADEVDAANHVYALHEIEGEEESTRGFGPNFWFHDAAAIIAMTMNVNHTTVTASGTLDASPKSLASSSIHATSLASVFDTRFSRSPVEPDGPATAAAAAAGGTVAKISSSSGGATTDTQAFPLQPIAFPTLPLSLIRQEEAAWQVIMVQRDEDIRRIVAAAGTSKVAVTRQSRRKRHRRELMQKCLVGRVEIEQYAERYLLDMLQQFEFFLLTSALEAMHIWKKVARKRSESPPISGRRSTTTVILAGGGEVNVAAHLRRICARNSLAQPAFKSSASAASLMAMQEEQQRISSFMMFAAWDKRVLLFSPEQAMRRRLELFGQVLKQHNALRRSQFHDALELLETAESSRRLVVQHQMQLALMDSMDQADILLAESTNRQLLVDVAVGAFQRCAHDVFESVKGLSLALSLLSGAEPSNSGGSKDAPLSSQQSATLPEDGQSGPPGATSTRCPSGCATPGAAASPGSGALTGNTAAVKGYTSAKLDPSASSQ